MWTNFFPDEPLIRSLDMDKKNWLVDETYILDNIKKGACVAAVNDQARLSLNHDSDKVRAHGKCQQRVRYGLKTSGAVFEVLPFIATTYYLLHFLKTVHPLMFHTPSKVPNFVRIRL